MKKKLFERLILSHPRDNVATATSPIKPGISLVLQKGKEIISKEDIPFGHKIALRRIPKGGAVIKYGERIGRTTCEIEPGEWVHVHNMTGERGRSKQRAKRIGQRA